MKSKNIKQKGASDTFLKNTNEPNILLDRNMFPLYIVFLTVFLLSLLCAFCPFCPYATILGSFSWKRNLDMKNVIYCFLPSAWKRKLQDLKKNKNISFLGPFFHIPGG